MMPADPAPHLVVRQASYPSFSWDRIPLYMHIRKAASYSDDEIAFLARFPLIAFEKANVSVRAQAVTTDVDRPRRRG
jgi:hypothetical protein